MAQGHPVLPPYGSGLGRERAVFPPILPLSPAPSAWQLRLSVNCKIARRGCAQLAQATAHHNRGALVPNRFLQRIMDVQVSSAKAGAPALADGAGHQAPPVRATRPRLTPLAARRRAGCPSEGDGRPAFMPPRPCASRRDLRDRFSCIGQLQVADRIRPLACETPPQTKVPSDHSRAPPQSLAAALPPTAAINSYNEDRTPLI
jgi:hypothetical protein